MDDLSFCTACGCRRTGTARFCGQCGTALTAAAPGAQPARPVPSAAPRVWSVAAFAVGDWAGAAAAVGAGIGAAIVLSAAAVLLLGVTDLPGITAGNVVALVAMIVALPFGGSVSASASTGLPFGDASATMSGSAGVDAAPLLVTAVSLIALSVVFVRRLRARSTGLADVVTQAARTWALLCAALLVVGLVGRTSPDTSLGGSLAGDGPGLVVAAGLAGTLTGATVWLLLALTLAVAWRLPAVLPPHVRYWRDAAGGPAAGAAVAVVVGCVLLGIGTLTGALLEGGLGSTGGVAPSLENAATGPVVACVLMFAPNLLLGAFGFASGVPLTVAAGTGGTTGPSTGTSTSLLDATTSAPQLWLAPLAVAVAALLGGVVAALHAPDVGTARRRSWSMGAALGVALVVIAVATSVSADGALLAASVGGTVHLDYVLAPLAGLAWGALGGLLGALVAPGLPAPVVQAARRHVVRARQTALGIAVPAPRPATTGTFGPQQEGIR